MIPLIWWVRAAAAAAGFSLLMALWAWIGLIRLKRKHLRFLGQKPAEGLEGWLQTLHSTIESTRSDMGTIVSRLADVQEQANSALTQVGLVRYNPFDDTGSDLSFSLALLTPGGDGVVITSLWGRDEVRVYAKPIQGRDSRYALSQEEKRAIDLAVDARRSPRSASPPIM